MRLRIERHIISIFGNIQLKDLTTYALITAWRPLEEKGQVETLRKLSDYIKDMSVFVQNTGRIENMHDLTHIKTNSQENHLSTQLQSLLNNYRIYFMLLNANLEYMALYGMR